MMVLIFGRYIPPLMFSVKRIAQLFISSERGAKWLAPRNRTALGLVLIGLVASAIVYMDGCGARALYAALCSASNELRSFSSQSADPEAPCLRFDMARRGPRRSELARRASVAAA